MLITPDIRYNLVPMTRIASGRIIRRDEMNGSRTMAMTDIFSTQREYDRYALRGNPLRLDGVDRTGDASQTHSPRRPNSRRVVNAEQEVGQP